jgi:hypothetical protein
MKKSRFTEEQMVRMLREAEKSSVAEVAALFPAELVMCVPTKRRVRERHAVSSEQLLYAHQRQRRIVLEPLLDANTVLVEHPPHLRWLRSRTVLHRVGDRSYTGDWHRDRA